MRTAALGALLLVAPLAPLACSGGSAAPGGAPEAGAEAAATADAADESCFPFCASSSSGGGSSGASSSGSGDDGGGDAALTCDQQKAQLEGLELAARACSATQPGQCSGTTDGVCCPVSVSAGNDSAVNDFAVAVAAYKQQCNPSCIGVVCPPTPSNKCQGSAGSQGTCQ